MKKDRTAEKKLLLAGSRQGWLDAPGMVVALSGGGDSVAMLWLLRSHYPGRLVAAHLDHCSREGASHEDAQFVRQICDAWDIACAVRRVDVEANRLTGESFEMAGRRERYQFFEETAKKENLPYIAVGHNADDLVETQLLNLFRGTGLPGLRGIPEARGNVVRPVIDFSRAELREILTENGIEWREDHSNQDSVYARNRIREALIPWVKENLNPNFESAMLGLARQVEAELAQKDCRTRRHLAAIAQVMPPALACWNAKQLGSFSDLELADLLRAQGRILGLPVLSRRRTQELATLLRRGGCWRFQWAADVEVCYSARGVGWLHRADVEKSAQRKDGSGKNEQLPWWAR